MNDMGTPGTGLNKQLGPFKLWQWGIGIVALGVAYWLYRNYKNNQATNAASTGTDTTAATPADTTGLTYATGGPSDLATALSSAFTDPTTGQPYFQELNTNLATATSQNAAIETAIANLTPNNDNMTHTTDTVPTPILHPSDINITIPPITILSGSNGNGTSTGSGGAASGGSAGAGGGSQIGLGSGAPANMLVGMTIAKQIEMVKSGAANVSQLGPNARKIYDAGGVSTAFPTAASLKGTLPPTALL